MKLNKNINNTILISIIQIKPSGKGVIIYNDKEYKIDRRKINKALDGDTVKIKLLNRKNKNKAEVIDVVKRSNKKYIGILERGKNYGFVVTKKDNIYTDFFIEKENLRKYKNEEKVLVEYKFWNLNDESPTGKIIKSLGKKGEVKTEIDSILYEYGLEIEFENKTLEELKYIKNEITKNDIENREDYRNKNTVTIDPKDAKDFDDAISLEKLKNNNFEVGIHIADVTHYVKPKTHIDKEAKKRGNSTYLVDRVIPMLPEKLSNQICSLRPNEDKLCFSCIVELNKNGKIIKSNFKKTVINSDYRFSYDEVQEILEKKTKIISKKNSLIGQEYRIKENIYDSIIELNKLAKKIRKKRIRKGSINFENKEIKFEIDKDKNPIKIYFKESKDSNKLVEEYMLLANRSLGELINKTKREFVYRVHDLPDNEKLENLKSIVKKLGYDLNIKPKKVGSSLNELLLKLKEKKEKNLIDKLALRAMSKAEYSIKNIGHYGLSFKNYTHFTSPIRRYSDILAHRILEKNILNNDNNEKELQKTCKHISKTEQLSTKVERASNKFMQVLFMSNKIGFNYKGVISGVTDRGMYVEIIENKCEGMISVKNMKDDFYIYNEKKHILIGEKFKRKYQLGDIVYIKVKKTNLEKRHLDFELLR